MSHLYNDIVGRLPIRWLRHIYLRRYCKKIGENCDIQMRCRFLNGRKVTLGNRNVVNFGCLLDGRKFSITTGNEVSIGPEATILTLGHDPQSSSFEDQGGDVTIGDRAWIAYRAIILPGVTIGEGAVVAAGAIVTKDVEPFTIVAGNPARKIGDRNKCLEYKLNFRSHLV